MYTYYVGLLCRRHHCYNFDDWRNWWCEFSWVCIQRLRQRRWSIDERTSCRWHSGQQSKIDRLQLMLSWTLRSRRKPDDLSDRGQWDKQAYEAGLDCTDNGTYWTARNTFNRMDNVAVILLSFLYRALTRSTIAMAPIVETANKCHRVPEKHFCSTKLTK